MTLEIIVLALALIFIGLVFIYTLISGSPPTPTSGRVRGVMLRLLPRRLPLSEPKLIYELGSGWSGLAPHLSYCYPNHQVIGIERSPLPWLISRSLAIFRRTENLSLYWGDFMQRDLSDATLVVCYLAGRQMEKLEQKLNAELRAGALVLTHTFAMPNWQPVDMVRADDFYRSPVYLYEMPAEPRGSVTSASQDATGVSSSLES